MGKNRVLGFLAKSSFPRNAQKKSLGCINTESQFPRLTRLTYLMCGFSSNDFMGEEGFNVGDRKFKRQKTPKEIAAEYADSLYEPEQWSR